MADKQLTESAWKDFVKEVTKKDKGRAYKDGAFVKALADWAKAEKLTADKQLDALADLETQAEALVKANKGDKDLAGFMDDLGKALAKQRKDADKLAKPPAADDEEDSPALLTSKLIPLIREVKKGEIVLQALVAIAGKETVLLLSKKPISAARGKLLKEQMTSPSGLKFIRGECLQEQGALTFVVQSQAGGLAKRLREALLKQTELRLKVRVRGEDPDDIDDDGEDEGDGAAPGASGGTARSTAGEAAQTADAQALQLRYAQRLAELEPQVAEALRSRTGDASKIRVTLDFAQEKAGSLAYGDGLKALDRLALLLGGAGAPGGQPDPLVAQAAQAWRSTRDGVVGRLRAMAKEIADTKDPEAATAIIEVSAVFKQLSGDPKSEQEVLALMRWVDTDDVVLDVSDIAEDIRTPLLGALRALQRALQPNA